MTQLENKVPLDRHGITAQLSWSTFTGWKSGNCQYIWHRFNLDTSIHYSNITFLFDNLHILSGKLTKTHSDILIDLKCFKQRYQTQNSNLLAVQFSNFHFFFFFCKEQNPIIARILMMCFSCKKEIIFFFQ